MLFDGMDAAQQEEYKQNIADRVVIFEGEDYKDLDPQLKKNIMICYKKFPSIKTKKGTEEMYINDAADIYFKDIASKSMRLSLRATITLVPTILISFPILF